MSLAYFCPDPCGVRISAIGKCKACDSNAGHDGADPDPADPEPGGEQTSAPASEAPAHEAPRARRGR